MSAAILLIDPKYPHNVGQSVRACAAYGIQDLYFTGDRMNSAMKELKRLPREERLRGYRSVKLQHLERPFDHLPTLTPVAVEIRPNSEALPVFEHPENALYVFGPEDGGLGSSVLGQCHRFVAIPSAHCLNLSMAVGTVLYDRQAKRDPARPLDTSAANAPGYFEVRDLLPRPRP
ncbi:MAG: TrmH family RNA methyltransferase [Pseudomonadota bacterium]